MTSSPISENIKIGTIILAGRPEISIPLKHTQVNAHLTGLLASVNVSQEFTNPLSQTVELIYLFPLPHEAALVDFKIIIGSRVIQADLREREQARQAYQQALNQGQHAALMDQIRPNLISLNIANVRPDETIQTNLQYDERLRLQADGIEFVFPMGLTPRYQSPAQPQEATPVNPIYGTKESNFGKVDIQLTADLGLSIGAPLSSSHMIEVDTQPDHRMQIHLAGQNIPDHDFILRFPLPTRPVEMIAWCGQDKAGEVIIANWLPGRPEETSEPPAPREFVFVLDRSGSMSGKPIAQARNALRACLRILEPQDSFRILLFDHELEWFQPEALPVTKSSVQNADSYLSNLVGRGGTEIIPALDAVVNLPARPNQLRYILFLTDGAVSAEYQALDLVRKKLKHARIFTFGIGPSVNRALLAKMAELGRGSAEFLQLDEDIEGAILQFQDMVAFPMLTDIQLEWKNCQVWDVYPALMPDLFAGQSLQLSARLKRSSPGKIAAISVKGKSGNHLVQYEMALPEADPEFPEAARLWARSRVEDLLDLDTSSPQPSISSRQEIINLAIEHRLLTAFTAFVALDSEIVNPSGENIPLPVSQPLPEGLDWDALTNQILPAPPAFATSAAPRGFTKLLMEVQSLNDKATGNLELPDLSAARRSHKNYRELNLPDNSNPQQLTRESDETNLDSTESTLRWLARTQDLEGSWADGFEFTAAALLAFIRNGQTTRTGYYRKQVKRAATWLEKTSPTGDDAYLRVLALAELGQVDQDKYWTNLAQQLSTSLPAPETPFQKVVMQRILSSSEIPQFPTIPDDLETFRLAAIMGTAHPINIELVKSNPSGLLRVWACVISSTQ